MIAQHAQGVERRAGTKGNADQQSTRRTQSWVSVSQALERIRQVARERRKERFTALFHHIGIELLAEAFCELKADAAPGVDQLTWKDYEADLGRNLEDLHDRVQRGAYRALPSRRVYIPKPDGRQRPLAVAARDIRLPGHQVQRLAAQQPRDDRDLALNGKALRTIPVDARRGTYASFGGALRRPFGARPSSLVMCNTPVEVQFTSAGCLNYPCRTPISRSRD